MLTFNIPGADPVLQRTVETRPKAVAEWLGRLPFASPADTAQQLLLALHGLNRHTLGEDDRSTLLALYRPVVARATASLEAQLADSGVPPHAQQKQIGTLLRELHVEHSIGYKLVLQGLTQRRFGRAHPKRVAETLARLLAALRDVIGACDLTRIPPPAGTWREIHQFHAYARTSNLADTAADDAPSAAQAYCQALLIALADPPHMSHAELLATRQVLDRFATLAVLAAAPVDGHQGFTIPTDVDAPPSHQAPAGLPPGALWLDTDALCRQLHEIAVRLRDGGAPGRIGLPEGLESGFGQALCKRLLKQWRTGSQRAFRRFAAPGSTMQMVAGVSAIHRLLELEPAAAKGEPDEMDSLPILDVETAHAAPIVVNATRWTVSNDSAAGLALSGTPGAPLNLKVGDPLGLRGDAATAWSLGVIRWIRMRDARQVELGIERLSPQVQPVWVQPLRGHRKTSPEPALFVPGVAALQQKDRLMLPRHLYQIGMDADVLHPPHRYTLTFGRCLEQTPSFDLIDFTIFSDEPT